MDFVDKFMYCLIVLVVSFIATFLLVGLFEVSKMKYACEKDLPRSERCVMVFQQEKIGSK